MLFGRLDRSLLRDIKLEFEKAATNSVYYRNQGGGGGEVISPILQAGLDYIALKGYTPLSDSSKEQLNATFTDPLFVTLYNAAPRIYIHHGDFDSDVACINWKNPSDSTTALKVNSPTYTNKSGFTGGGTSYLNYQWVPSTDGAGLYEQDDAGIILYTEGAANSNPSLGVFNGVSYIHIVTRRSTSDARGRVNNSVILVAATTGNGLFQDWRRISSTLEAFKEGVSIGSGTLASIGLPTESVYGLCYNIFGSPSNFYPGLLSCFIPYKSSLANASDNYTWWTAHKLRVAE